MSTILRVFSTKGAEKRKQHGSKGCTVFRDPAEADRVWVIFDWDDKGWQSFVSDPEVPAILKEAGHQGKPRWPSSPAATTPSPLSLRSGAIAAPLSDFQANWRMQ